MTNKLLHHKYSSFVMFCLAGAVLGLLSPALMGDWYPTVCLDNQQLISYWHFAETDRSRRARREEHMRAEIERLEAERVKKEGITGSKNQGASGGIVGNTAHAILHRGHNRDEGAEAELLVGKVPGQVTHPAGSQDTPGEGRVDV